MIVNARKKFSVTGFRKLSFSGLLVCLLSAGLFNGCADPRSKYKFVIGVSYQNLQNEFIINIQDAVRKRAKERGLGLIELDAQGKPENQIAQIENFIAADVDAIIINPCDNEGSAPAIDIAVRDKKPVVAVNSIVANVAKANAFVGSEDTEAGRIAAQYIMDVLGGKGNIAVMHGVNGHSAEVQRTEGINQIVKKYPGAHIVVEQTANWDRAQGMALMENWLSAARTINAVIAQNDEMALGAYKAIEAAGKQKEIKVIGIDAIQDALKSVAENKMAGTVFQDAAGQGALAIDLAEKAALKQKPKHTHYIPFKLITKSNLDSFIHH